MQKSPVKRDGTGAIRQKSKQQEKIAIYGMQCNFGFCWKGFHTTYTRNNMSQKCEGNSGLWVLNEIIQKIYPENLKKIVGAVWELPAR